MGYYGSDQVSLFLLGGYDILGSLTSITDKQSAVLEEDTRLGQAWQSHKPVGLNMAALTQDGYYDDAANGAHQALSTGPGVSRVLCFGLEGTATGAEFVGYSGAMQVDYERIAAHGALTKAKASYKGNGIVEEGQIVRMLAGAVASGKSTGTPVDYGASNVSGISGYLQVTSFSSGAGATGLAVDIFDSPDNVTYSSYMQFGNATAAPYAERKVSTSPIQRYVAERHQGASGAGFPSSATFFVGVAPK